MSDEQEKRVPPAYQEMFEQFGGSVGVHQARQRWSELVTAAEAGMITLITREHHEWTALVPISEVAEPMAGLPMWPLVAARKHLGDLVRAAVGSEATGYRPISQILTRHRKPVAAIIYAKFLDGRPEPTHRFRVEDLLQTGHLITLKFDPGESGWVDERGDAVDEGYPEHYIATATDHQGNEVGSGVGDSVAEALLRMRPPQTWPDPSENPADDHWASAPPVGTVSGFSDEPPF